MRRSQVVLVGMGNFLVLAGIAFVIVQDQVEDRLVSDAQHVLVEAGYADVAVEADGRDLVVRGTSDAEVLELIASVDGVRRAEFGPAVVTPTTSTSTVAAPTSTTAPVPTPTSPLTSPPATTAAPTTTAAPLELQDLIDAAVGEVAFLADDPDEPTVETKARLDVVAGLLLDHPEVQIRVTGHVVEVSAGDEDPGSLSLARAWAVAGYLEWRGISFDRQQVVGAGSATPRPGLDPSDPDNDRIDIRVVEEG